MVLILGGSPSIESQDCNSFTVMSYNVLAQQLLENHKYLYRKHDIRALTWEYRSTVLLKEIREADADVSASVWSCVKCFAPSLIIFNEFSICSGIVSAGGSSKSP